MLFWLQLISCSRFVNMAELHHRYNECCSSDELDSCASKEHVSLLAGASSTFLKLESYLKDYVQKVWTAIARGSLSKIAKL